MIPWSKASRWYGQLKVEDYMNDSWLSANDSKCYEQLKVVNYINYSESWAEGYGCYEQLSIMNDMNERLRIPWGETYTF